MEAKWLRRPSAGKSVVASLIMFVMFVMFVAFTSCSSEDDPGSTIWDISPTTVDIKIVDADGANLLDENAEGNWMNQPFTLTCDGETYEVKWPKDWIEEIEPEAPNSRYIMPHFYGFAAFSTNYWNGEQWTSREGQYKLSFGEFAAEDDLNLSLQLKVPGLDKVYDIAVTHRCRWKKGEPHITNKITLNGEPVDKFPIEIVLPRLSSQQ